MGLILLPAYISLPTGGNPVAPSEVLTGVPFINSLVEEGEMLIPICCQIFASRLPDVITLKEEPLKRYLRDNEPPFIPI